MDFLLRHRDVTTRSATAFSSRRCWLFTLSRYAEGEGCRQLTDISNLPRHRRSMSPLSRVVSMTVDGGIHPSQVRGRNPETTRLVVPTTQKLSAPRPLDSRGESCTHSKVFATATQTR
ncbi:hypothetical protein ISCGN_021944 [Ixodes scapularis]